jgi:murein tripeptide amidase MpaA
MFEIQVQDDRNELRREILKMSTVLVRITANTLEQLRALDGLDLDLQRRAARQSETGQFTIPSILDEEQIRRLQASGYQVDLVADLAITEASRRQEMSEAIRTAEARGMADVETRAVMGYLSAAEVEDALARLSAAHPDLVTLITLPYRTWEGRVCHAIRLRAGTSGARTGVLFTGSMHAREWGGADACVAFVTSLIDAYCARSSLVYGGKTFSATQVQTMFRRLNILVFPDVNPDGKNYSQTASMWWRKNRNPNTPVDPVHPGVDLNRNFDFLCSSGIGTSANPVSDTYKGVAPFSEPETRNVRYLLDRFPTIHYYLDIHSYSGLILYPWGDDDNQSSRPEQNFRNPAFDGQRGKPGGYREFMAGPDQHMLVDLANRMNAALTAVRGTHYTVQQAVGLYPTSATSDDYVFSRHLVAPSKRKVYPFTIEFGTEFIPPFAEMRQIIGELCSAMTELCLAAAS